MLMMLNDANIEPEIKILILLYIFVVVLPDILNRMPEICHQSDKAKANWLLKELHTKSE